MGLGGNAKDMIRRAFQGGISWLVLAGVGLTTASAMTLIAFWAMEVLSPRPVNPYTGILLFMGLPSMFVLGLLLIPLGLLQHRRKLRREGKLEEPAPKLDFASSKVRMGLVWVGVATLVNLAIVGTATVKGASYSDSNEFCGLTCHKVMAPEYTAFVDSPHARVGCSRCHIGPGAGWLVKSKLSGVRQVFAVTFNTYSRPIPSPVESLRPARETCEQCHWPRKFSGDKLLVRKTYAEDESTTPSTTALLLKIGGRTWQGTQGIHGRHLDDGERISYIATDKARSEIAKVIYRDDDGKLVEFLNEDLNLSPEALAKFPVRKMDCVDCHNRPTHAFELPGRAVDRALTEGRLSRDLPYIKKTAVEVLKHAYPDRATATREIPEALSAFYRVRYPQVFAPHKDQVDQAGRTVLELYLRNVFPEMKLTWGTHPNHIGHQDFPGCFRCHGGSHTSSDGRSISSSCTSCHTILAQGAEGASVLKQLGIP